MSQMIELRVPDIGDFKDVPVIELLVAVGDVIAVDTALVTLESDKAMDAIDRRRPDCRNPDQDRRPGRRRQRHRPAGSG